ncbi:MAG: hypothetical protein R3F59_03100 [Myxococcota bacterium]
MTEFCFSYWLDYTDGATGDLLTGTSTNAHGVFVEFYDQSTNNVAWDGYVSDSSPDAGCIRLDTTGPVLLNDAHQYTVKVYREALVSGNTILVRGPTGSTLVYIAASNFQPSGAHGTYEYANGDSWTRLAANDPTLIMAAAKYGLQRRWAGLSGETFTFRNAACNGSGNFSCYDYTNERVWIAHPERKFEIAHMMGYALSHFANGHDDPVYDPGAAMDGCIPGESHSVRINTKEYGSENAVQAFAQFYAAVAFNDDGTDADCEYQVSYDVDWNADQDSLDVDEYEVFSCSDSPAPNQSPPIPDYAYFDYKSGCGGTIDNRGTSYDWLKMLWDYRTDSVYGGYSVADIYDLWDAADPDSWVAAGNLGGGSQNYPYDRFYDAEGGDPFGDWNLLGAGVHGIQH